jgi:effector-binding domain-containing protein
MKLVLFAISIITTGFVITFFIPVNQSNEIHVEANFFNVLEQLNYPFNWTKWQPSLQQVFYKDSVNGRIKNDTLHSAFSIEIPGHIFYVKKVTPLTFAVQEKTPDNLSVYAITVVSTTLPNRTNVVTTRRISLFNYIFGNNKRNAAAVTANNLKAFLESPTAYYGFPLRIENVVDTNVVVTKKIVATREQQQQLQGMYYNLSAFIQQHHLIAMQPKIASLKIISNDSTEIMAGIPVNKTAPSSADIQCVKMPKGRMLVGEYGGIYNKRAGLTNAMEKYIHDHTMVSVAVPYEKYLNDSIPATDTSIVKLKMYYPVL